MHRTLAVTIVAAVLAGCGSTSSWMPWGSKEERPTGPGYTPPGATGYACEGGKRLLVRFDSDGKSAWIIYPDRQLRLDRVTATAGNDYARADTILSTRDGETSLTEGNAVQVSKCKPEGKT